MHLFRLQEKRRPIHVRHFPLGAITFEGGALGTGQPELVADDGDVEVREVLAEFAVSRVFEECLHVLVVRDDPVHFGFDSL